LIYNQIFKLAIALSRWRDHTELENVNGRAHRRVFSRNKPFAFFAPRPPNRIRISGCAAHTEIAAKLQAIQPFLKRWVESAS
jgi:hypothetical protein